MNTALFNKEFRLAVIINDPLKPVTKFVKRSSVDGGN